MRGTDNKIQPEEFFIRIQISSNGVSVQPGSEGADVQFVQGRDPLKEGGSAGPDPGVVPGGVLPVQLEVINILQVGGNTVIGGVDESLVQVHQQHQLPVLGQSALILSPQILCLAT